MSDRNALAAMLARLSYRRGTFQLASGKSSDFYVDVKQTVMSDEGAALVGRLVYERLHAHAIDCVGGMAVGAVPLVAAASSAGAPARRLLRAQGSERARHRPQDRRQI